MVINKKLVRSSGSVKLRLTGALLITAFSVMLMVSFALAMKSVSARLDEFREDNSLHDIRIKTLTPIDGNEQMDNAEFEPRYILDADLSDGKLLHIASVTEKIDTVLVTSGTSIQKSGEMLLDSLYAETNNVNIGDKIDIFGKKITVCGFYTSPDTVLPTKYAESIMVSSDSFGLAAMSADDVKSFGKYETEYLIKLKNADNDRMNELINTLHTNYSVTDCKKAVEDNRATYIDGDLKLFSEDLLILPEIFIIIAAFSCAAVISRIMKAETTQIGVLYALGYKRITLYFHYMLYPAVVAVGGAVTGIILGILMSPSIAGILKLRYLLPDFKMHIYADVPINAAIMPIIFMIVICSASILIMLLRTPLELIKNEKEPSKLASFTHLTLKSFPFGLRFTIRSLLRNLPRELFLVGGVALSSMLMLTYVSMISSLSGVLNESFESILKYNYMYTFAAPQTEKHDGVCLINNIPVLLDGDYININGTSDEFSMMNYENVDGTKTDFSQNIITNNMARKYSINEGDTITLTNSMNNDVYKIKIDKICISYVENFISIPLDEFNEMTGQTQGSYVIIASNDELDIANKSSLTSVDTIAANKKAIGETVLPLNILLAILLIMAVVVALIVIVTVTSVIIEESRHTISLMKVFGYAEKRIAKLVIDGNAFAAALGYMLSIPLVLRISNMVFEFMSDTLGMYIPATLNALYCAIGFLFVMLIFFASKLIMQKKVFDTDAADAIKAKE